MAVRRYQADKDLGKDKSTIIFTYGLKNEVCFRLFAGNFQSKECFIRRINLLINF